MALDSFLKEKVTRLSLCACVINPSALYALVVGGWKFILLRLNIGLGE